MTLCGSNIPLIFDRYSTTRETTKTAEKGRTHFNYVLKQCEELLKSMGLICVQATGEAEAFCAYLNKENVFQLSI